MKRPLKPGESPFSSAKIVKRLSKLNLSKHSSKKTAKKKHFCYLNAPHNTTSFLINEFIKNKSPSDEECDIPQGSMKDLMNSSTDFYKSSFSSFAVITTILPFSPDSLKNAGDMSLAGKHFFQQISPRRFPYTTC